MNNRRNFKKRFELLLERYKNKEIGISDFIKFQPLPELYNPIVECLLKMFSDSKMSGEDIEIYRDAMATIKEDFKSEVLLLTAISNRKFIPQKVAEKKTFKGKEIEIDNVENLFFVKYGKVKLTFEYDKITNLQLA